MQTSDVFFLRHWVIDWEKVTRWEDLKELLMCCDMRPNVFHPQFEEIKHLLKCIDSDGKTLDIQS